MADDPDFKELLRTFNEKETEYLIVGGYAVMKYTEPRFTKGLDLWIRNSQENARHTCLVRRHWPWLEESLCIHGREASQATMGAHSLALRTVSAVPCARSSTMRMATPVTLPTISACDG